MKERINFKKGCKMYLACSNEDLRPVMQYVFFKDGFAYASDAHILIKNKLSEITELVKEEDLLLLEGKYLHKIAFQKILAYDRIKIIETGILCRDKWSYHEVEFRFADNCGVYPNAEVIFTQANSKEGTLNRFSISPSLLNKLNQSLYSDGKLVLKFSGSEMDPILVKSYYNGVQSEAVIMPVSLD